MATATWLIPQLTLNEELELEKQVWAVKGCDDLDTVVKLAAMLLRQNRIYQRLLQNATGRIAELELRELLMSPH